MDWVTAYGVILPLITISKNISDFFIVWSESVYLYIENLKGIY